MREFIYLLLIHCLRSPQKDLYQLHLWEAHDVEYNYIYIKILILIHIPSPNPHSSDHHITNLSNINAWVHIFTSNTLFGIPPKGFVSIPSLRSSRYMCLPHARIFSNLNLPLQNMDPAHNLWINLNNREWYGHAPWISGDVVDGNQPPKRICITLIWKHT